jgi:hypothetical protein
MRFNSAFKGLMARIEATSLSMWNICNHERGFSTYKSNSSLIKLSPNSLWIYCYDMYAREVQKVR